MIKFLNNQIISLVEARTHALSCNNKGFSDKKSDRYDNYECNDDSNNNVGNIDPESLFPRSRVILLE